MGRGAPNTQFNMFIEEQLEKCHTQTLEAQKQPDMTGKLEEVLLRFFAEDIDSSRYNSGFWRVPLVPG